MNHTKYPPMLEQKWFEKKWFTGLVLLIVVLIGFYLRFDNIDHWLDNKGRYFFGEPQLPLMLTVDAYYYLDVAKQLQKDVYQAFDARRQVPNGFYRTEIPPLLSVLLASLSSWVDKPLEWVALVVSPVLGALLAIPVYLLGYALTLRAKINFASPEARIVSARLMGLIAALFAVLSPKLVSRSSPGWFDTDNLNVFFPILIAWLCIRFADATASKQRYSFFAAIVLVFFLFLWWWEQSVLPVLLLTGLPLFTAAVFIGKRQIKDLWPMLGAGVTLVLMLGVWKGFAVLNPVQYMGAFKGMLGYITSDTSNSVFFAAGDFVSEQRKTPFPLLVEHSAGGSAAFKIACGGLLTLVWRTRLYSLFLMAIFAVAALSVTGQRFLIFSAPLFGLGVASLAVLAHNPIKPFFWKIPVIVLFLVGTGWGAVVNINKQEQMVPRRMPVLFDAMVKLREVTEKDAVIWASWGHGHPMIHYSERGTVGDGIFHPASLQYVTDVPLATDNYRLAANWIQFYVAHGHQGMTQANKLFSGEANGWDKGTKALKQLLGAGVDKSRELLQKNYAFTDQKTEQTLAFLFPKDSRPSYLFLEYLLLEQPWFHLGTWDFATRSGANKYTYLVIENISPQATGQFRGRSRFGNVLIDTEKGVIQVGKHTRPLRMIKMQDGQALKVKKYRNKSSAVLNLIGPSRFGVLGTSRTANTVLTKLYFEIPLKQPYFTPAAINLPSYSIWKVKGEPYTELTELKDMVE